MDSTAPRRPDQDPNQFMYQRYVSSGGFGPAPASQEDMAPRMPVMRDLVRRFFPADRDAEILDLGCGNGVLLLAAQREGYRRLQGVDGSAEQVAIAQRLGISGVRQGDLFEALARTADGSLDALVTYDVIEHLTKQDLLRLAQETLRVLKPGGRWIIHAPNAESPFFGRIRYGDFTHELAFTRQSLGALLRAAGFADVVCAEDAPIPHGLKSMIRLALWKLVRSVLRFVIAVETGDMTNGIYSQNLIAMATKSSSNQVVERQ
ncbi:class I SAM-dependent methyltransferase [Bradyrhizobium sp. HKCCYLR20261]|uniref:class I SAM-dependent methyltransferase n=1 Tax=Bradyrhizobium sp. HKCCYLR20261 TaxID=3420760 RepID=UPI003EB708A9